MIGFVLFISVAFKLIPNLDACLDESPALECKELYETAACSSSSGYKLCRKTCNICVCGDRYPDCKRLLKFSTCYHSSNKAWMAENCKETCNFCNPLPRGSARFEAYSADACGRSIAQSSRVIGGKSAASGDWPWQVALYSEDSECVALMKILNSSGPKRTSRTLARNRYLSRNMLPLARSIGECSFFFCGGSLVAPQWVVTAAHCLERILKPAELQVILGTVSRSNPDAQTQIVNVEQFIIHPDYKSDTFSSDIALIKLARPALINEKVRTVCLPYHGVDPIPGEECAITGWGVYEVGGTAASQVLQAARTKIVDQETCTEFNKEFLKKDLITKKVLCAGMGPKNQTDACHGDSGGPLVCQNSENQWVLHGVTSYGSPDCDTRQAYGVYTRVTKFSSWIADYIKS